MSENMSSEFQTETKRTEALLRRAFAGEQEAIGQLLEGQMEFLYGVCYRLLLHRDDAEEAVAETLYRAYHRFASFRGDSQFTTWLYRIATNVCLDLLRRQRSTQPLETEDGSPALQLPSSLPSALHQIEKEEERGALQALLERLPPVSRLVLTLRELQELPYERIAEVMRCSEGTIKSRLHRAKKQAQQVLAKDQELRALLSRQSK
ncbi:MAG: RNA polymerase sigma factor [Coprothermobacterota bacterium]|nr:RNA polymerase sigma factor [Coprothermobacterota bacterium]